MRRTWRAIGTSTLIRRFNLWAVEELRAAEGDEKKRAKITRAEEGNRVRLWSEFMSNFLEEVRAARADPELKEQIEAIHAMLGEKKAKASAGEQQKLVAGFEKGIKSAAALGTTYAAEKESGYEKTAFMKGRVFISALVKGQGHNQHLNDELFIRKVYEMDLFVKEYGEIEGLDGSDGDEALVNTFLNGINYTARKKMLRWHVAKEEVSKNPSLSLNDAYDKYNSFDPRSNRCKQFLLPEEREEAEGDA